MKFSQNFQAAKVIGNGTTSLICTAIHIAICISLGVVYCLYPLQRQCEKPHLRIRTIVPTPIFILKAERGNREATNKTKMVILDEIFESKINEFQHEGLVRTEDFSDEQKTAFIKAVLYVVSADNIITEDEKIFLSQFYPDIINTSHLYAKSRI